MLRLSLESELAAATDTAVRLGLGTVTPEVLHFGNHTTARLAPWPIVARIASGTSFDFDDDSLAREVAIAAHLGARDAPAVRPATEVPPGPHFDADCAVTLWQLVEGRAVETASDEFMAAASLRLVHAALADVDADLPAFIIKVESCDAILSDAAEAPKLAVGDRLFLQRIYGRFRSELERIDAPWRPLHGDTHLGNVLITASRAVWMDLEAACMGPLEWDVVNLPTATWPEFGSLDPKLMRLFADVRRLCLAVWCWAEFDRSPASAEAAVHHLVELKRRFG